jgi:glycosyltransferase involved in cell wall biosynthesis
MKVLYISYYKEDNSDWAASAINNMLALDRAGVDVVARNVTITSDGKNLPQKIKQLQVKSTEGCDVCIQHVLPHHLVGTDQFKKNIAYFSSESTSIKHLPWFNSLQLVDEIWVPNQQSRQFLLEDKIGKPVRVAPRAFNMENYTKKYEDIQIPQAKGRFKFYYIGDLNERQNIDAVIRCFHAEFDKSEQACLILKVNNSGYNSEQVQQSVDQKIVAIKNSLRIYREVSEYNKDIIISEDVDSEKIYALHQSSDCFVNPSRGEAWSVPSFEAMAFGNTPICSDFGGSRDFIDKEDHLTGKLVGGTYATCQCSDSAFPDMFTGREYWFSPCDMDTRKAMRFYYESKDTKREKKIAGLTRAKKFSYENVGNLMKGFLNE